MRANDLVYETVSALTANRARSLLTILGVVIGIAAVIAMTAMIGGIKNANRKKYVVCFHHPDPEDGDIWVTIVGKNENGFSLAFAKDAESVVDAEFKALAQDGDGTLIRYVEVDNTITTSTTTEG